jgi:outer membrane usher protein
MAKCISRRGLSLAFLPLLLVASQAAAAGAEDWEKALEPLLLDVTVNGQEDAGPQQLLRDGHGHIYASDTSLKRWRIALPQAISVQFDGETYRRLDSSAAVTAVLTEADQTIAITADANLFGRQEQSFGGTETMPMTAPANGTFTNYDVFLEYARGRPSLSGAVEVGLFNRHGFGVSSFVGRAGQGAETFVRLDSSWTIDRPNRMTSVRFGDGVTVGGPHAPPVRFAGLQYARNFATRPGFVTLPLPGVSGSAALPSVLDIYVNNVLQGSRDVAPGPFDLTGVPLQAGSGNVRLVVRDLLGRETVTTQNYYVSTRMLQANLHDFSYEIGFLRRDFGTKSASYGTLMAAATHRFGVTDRLTVDGQAEATRDQQLVGAGLAVLVGEIGVLSASGGFSHSARGLGRTVAMGLERSSRHFSLGVRTELTSKGYSFVGIAPRELPSVSSSQAFLNFPFRGGSLGFNYLDRDNRGKADESLAGLAASFELGKMGSLQLFARRSAIGRPQTVIGAFFAVALGGGRNASAALEYGRDQKIATLSFEKGAPFTTGSGYRAMATLGTVNSLEGTYSLNTPLAALSAQASHGRGGTGIRLSAAGAVGRLGGHTFASRHIGSSFGAVRLDGYPGVRVYADNQLIGTTGKSGMLIIPTLRAFERNRIAIDPADLALDVQIAEGEVAIRPYARTGTVIDFLLKRERGALLQVSLEDGSRLPAGARVFRDDSPEGFVVALDGIVYVPDLSGKARLKAIWKSRSCLIELLVPANDDPQPFIPGLVCRGGEIHAAL